MSKRVVIGKIETKPERDPYQNLDGVSSNTKLRLDPRDRKAHVYQDYRTGSTLMTVYNGLELELPIAGHPDEDDLREYLTNGVGQDLLRAICDGHEIVWNGQNNVGRLTDEAEGAVDRLELYLSEWDSKYTFWETGEWLYEGAAEHVTANTTDAELARLAKEFEEIAEAENVVLDGDVLGWLTRFREDVRIGLA